MHTTIDSESSYCEGFNCPLNDPQQIANEAVIGDAVADAYNAATTWAHNTCVELTANSCSDALLVAAMAMEGMPPMAMAAEAADVSAVATVASDAAPLAQKIASTFEGGDYVAMTLQEDLTVYRGYGGPDAGPIGRWFGTVKPTTAAEAETMYNVRMYGNQLTDVSTVQIPKGTTVYYWRVAGGTGFQLFLPNAFDVVKVLSTHVLAP
jgi:hypothetical protein